jgi:hypothetical protein
VIMGAGPAHAAHFGMYEFIREISGGRSEGWWGVGGTGEWREFRFWSGSGCKKIHGCSGPGRDLRVGGPGRAVWEGFW